MTESALDNYLKCYDISSVLEDPEDLQHKLRSAREELVTAPLAWATSKIESITKENKTEHNEKYVQAANYEDQYFQFHYQSTRRRVYSDPNKATYTRLDPVGVAAKHQTTAFRYESVEEFKKRYDHPYKSYLDYLTDTKSDTWSAPSEQLHDS